LAAIKLPVAAWLLTAANLVIAPSTAGAADYPVRPIRIIVGFAAGGAADALPRIIGEKLIQDWGQPVVVENRTGAQGNTAMAAVAKAEPDGYTLALMPVGNAAINPSLMPNLPYNPVKDFAPITEIATVENVLVISAQSPVPTLTDLIALGRGKNANLSYATPGAGSLAHLAAELLARSSGFELNHVPYRGVSPALTDVVRGEVTIMFAQLSTAKPLIDGGQLRALGIASRARSPIMPAVPTVAEAAGIADFEAVSWYALMAPAHTPDPIIRKLHEGVRRALTLPDVKAALEAQGATPLGSTPEQLAATIAADTARWAKVIREAKIEIQQ
jgi:tripartite-type tricarboxylate transporter receptor subunit TctC